MDRPGGPRLLPGPPQQAPRDCEHALEVVTAHCLSAESQARAVDALSFKCDVLWSLMDAIDRAYPE